MGKIIIKSTYDETIGQSLGNKSLDKNLWILGICAFSLCIFVLYTLTGENLT